MRPPVDHILSRPNSVHIFIYMIRFNIMPSLMPRCPARQEVRTYVLYSGHFFHIMTTVIRDFRQIPKSL